MAIKADDDITKITVKVWTKAWNQFNRKIRDACLRRDHYLNRVLEVELPHLEAEVSMANSPEAERFVVGRVEALERRSVSLALRVKLVEQLNAICREKRIVRDAFFNRLFLLLAASPKVIDRLYFFAMEGDWRAEVWSEFKHDGPFFQNVFYPLEQEIDPLWPLRESLRLDAERSGATRTVDPATGREIEVQRTLSGQLEPVNSIYTAPFDENTLKGVDLRAMNVYTPDRLVPDSTASKTEQDYIDAFIEIMAKPEGGAA